MLYLFLQVVVEIVLFRLLVVVEVLMDEEDEFELSVCVVAISVVNTGEPPNNNSDNGDHQREVYGGVFSCVFTRIFVVTMILYRSSTKVLNNRVAGMYFLKKIFF